MYEGFDITAFLMGLPLGMLIAGIAFFFHIRKGKKKRLFDERYTRIHHGARSVSWHVTALVILLSWTFVIMYERPGLAFTILTVLWLVHIVSYGIGVMILNKKY